MSVRYSKEELAAKIAEETVLISELEAGQVPLIDQNNLYAPENTDWHIHQQSIRDAYWRRRNWVAYMDDPEYNPSTNPG